MLLEFRWMNLTSGSRIFDGDGPMAGRTAQNAPMSEFTSCEIGRGFAVRSAGVIFRSHRGRHLQVEKCHIAICSELFRFAFTIELAQ